MPKMRITFTHRIVSIFLCCMSLIAVTCTISASASSFSEQNCANYFRGQQWKECADYCQRWTQAEPGNATAWYSLGNAYGSRDHKFGLQMPEKAAEAYKRSVQLDPRAAKVWNALGHASYECGNKPDALNAFQKATQLEPNNAKYWNSLGSINGMGENTNDAAATKAYKRAERLGSADAKRNDAIIHQPIVTTTNGWNFGTPGAGSYTGGIPTSSYNYYHHLDHNGSPIRDP